MKHIKTTVTALILSTSAIAGPASAETIGTFMREGVEPILVHIEGNQLYCTQVSDGFELCNGMDQQADGSWTGRRLKNPDMPGFMSFRGTITFEATQMNLEGCAMGGTVCKTKTWPLIE